MDRENRCGARYICGVGNVSVRSSCIPKGRARTCCSGSGSESLREAGFRYQVDSRSRESQKRGYRQEGIEGEARDVDGDHDISPGTSHSHTEGSPAGRGRNAGCARGLGAWHVFSFSTPRTPPWLARAVCGEERGRSADDSHPRTRLVPTEVLAHSVCSARARSRRRHPSPPLSFRPFTGRAHDRPAQARLRRSAPDRVRTGRRLLRNACCPGSPLKGVAYCQSAGTVTAAACPAAGIARSLDRVSPIDGIYYIAMDSSHPPATYPEPCGPCVPWG